MSYIFQRCSCTFNYLILKHIWWLLLMRFLWNYPKMVSQDLGNDALTLTRDDNSTLASYIHIGSLPPGNKISVTMLTKFYVATRGHHGTIDVSIASQYWFKQWLDTVRHEVTTRFWHETDLLCHKACVLFVGTSNWYMMHCIRHCHCRSHPILGYNMERKWWLPRWIEYP